MEQARFDQTFAGWRDEARRLLLAGVRPEDVNWLEHAPSFFSAQDLFASESAPPPARLTVPAEFLALAEEVSFARDEDRWDLLYRILFRLQHENRELLNLIVDADIHRALALRKSIHRDIHKMHAFVRFKKTRVENEEHYIAWHKPEHRIVRPGSTFFARRFGDRRWSIFTPDESAHWDLQTLTYGPGMPQADFHTHDDWDEVWKTYYKSIFNPARIKIKAMKTEMAPKYWSTMPETELIRELVREAPQRLQKMAANQNQAAQVDANLSLPDLRAQAALCQSCPLHRAATQTVFGQGPDHAEIMIVGEQPGDQEDRAGVPFVGPAGEVLNEALQYAGLDRASVYLTNAVKHFKWKASGKTRLHQKPSGGEMHACKPWLEAEIARVKPKVIVALGATAATAVLGRLPKISEERGRVMTGLPIAPAVLVSWHPAAILRAGDAAESQERRQQLGEDLRLAARCLRSETPQKPPPDPHSN